ncbi:receptor kinase-like protein Xa21 [Lycium ferocissimum]|uniref:receptor kinase-like protein Xa21 n=1 Tax=Lycium ferocissimum TaxID=112874 RepID=UPI0028158E63|nr:receptor kinase-like protein Xa21 [Lycium ferocissimum]
MVGADERKGYQITKALVKREIPVELGNLKKLQRLNCFQNELTGSIPPSIFNVSTLQILALSFNKFSGPIPNSLGNLEYLEYLNLGMNHFFSDSTLSFLTSLTNCRNLRSLTFDDNPLDGVLPASVGNLSDSLQSFEGNHCKLKGIIPQDIGNLTGLTRMSLSGNQFSGSVPPCLGNVTSLRYLFLAYNRLNSRLPASLGSLQDLIEFDVSSNFLSGKIPQEIGNLKAAILIDLSKNKFSGNIPSTLGGLDKLINLSLAHNRLDGPIPNSFGKMLALEFLDLCYNNLSGEIPKSLEALVYLKYLNFSFNKLSGEIPTGGYFANTTSQSFLSNDALCGDSRFNVKPCVIQSSMRKKVKRRCVFVKGHERISYYELEQATNGFDESNLLGNGSFSMVYKGILKDGTLFAVKVFNVQLEGAFNNFDTECEILRNLRHRNLIKVITSCSNPDFKALALEYMPNGTLDKWLYSHNLFMNLLQRLDIMIDVGSAMDYLHNGCSIPVVHSDLKPNNVLLDQEMVGHVSDFGIAKLLGTGKDFVQTRTIATIGYIAPEYGQDGIVSMSCDVYSFGILMMETFTRTKPSDEIFTGDLSIQRWVSDSFPSEIHNVVDSNLVQPWDEQIDAKMQCLSSIMELALSCTLATPNARISMKDSLSTLKKIRFQFVSSRH